MNIKKNPYLQNFIVTCAGAIGFSIVFLAFGLDIFHSLKAFFSYLAILIGFTLFVLLLKGIFKWVDMDEVVNGVWIGIALYCWSPIFTLSWLTNFWNALAGASIYFVIGLVILIAGYLFRIKK